MTATRKMVSLTDEQKVQMLKKVVLKRFDLNTRGHRRYLTDANLRGLLAAEVLDAVKEVSEYENAGQAMSVGIVLEAHAACLSQLGL